MSRGKRPWWLPVVVAGLALPVSGCSFGGAERCEKAFAAAAMSVPGVSSAVWDCSDQFGGGWQRADVVLEASTEDEAIVIMNAMLKAFAASPEIEDGWSTPHEYKTHDRSIVVAPKEFGGIPNIREVRARYGIVPAGKETG